MEKLRLKASTLSKGRIERVPGGGFLTYFEGHKYPVHGRPTDEGLWAIEMLKKHIIADVRMISFFPQIVFTILLFPFFKRIVKQWLFQLARYSETVVDPYVIVEDLSPAVIEFYRAGIKTWPNSGKHKTEENNIKLICGILEHDKGYRFIFQDIMACASREQLIKHPAREFSRIISVYLQREQRRGYKGIGTLIKILLWTQPWMRRAIKDFATHADFKNFYMDRWDLWAALQAQIVYGYSYAYGGYDYKTMQALYVKI